MKNEIVKLNLILAPLHIILGVSITLGLILTTSNVIEWALSSMVVIIQCLLILAVPNFIYFLVKRKKGWTVRNMLKSIFYPSLFYIGMAIIGLLFVSI
ncbi:hypothetical protein SAMN05216565_106194 [Litchfieldia salsa]|uniref:Uncharacterized protein n=1 Tax=Litchfieldia salsa TaxID=930152 RepID=A0A1H0VCR3_9BACI|nr:hypothetical protein SAMN05216565_106194 [Litchfieldia salsa]